MSDSEETNSISGSENSEIEELDEAARKRLEDLVTRAEPPPDVGSSEPEFSPVSQFFKRFVICTALVAATKFFYPMILVKL